MKSTTATWSRSRTLRPIITERDIQKAAPGETFYVGPGALLTDLARETAELSGVIIVYANAPVEKPAVPTVVEQSARKLCVNLPDKEQATYRVEVSGGTVTIYEQTDGQMALRETVAKRICRHPH